jgi:hypothetical protein
LRSCDAGFAARAGGSLRPIQTARTRRALRAFRALLSCRAWKSLLASGARRSWFALNASGCAIADHRLALAGAGSQDDGAIHRVIGEAKCEATRSVAGDGEAVVGRHCGMGARRISGNDQLARRDGDVLERDAGARTAALEFAMQPGFLMAVERFVMG